VPRHLRYLEACGGGLSLLLARDPNDPRFWIAGSNGKPAHLSGVAEIANDINDRLMNFWRVLQKTDTFEQFRRRVEAVPVARAAWEGAEEHLEDQDPVSRAVAFFIRTRQSRQGLAKNFVNPVRNRTRRRMEDNVSSWLSAVDGLADVHARLRRVLLENMDASELIRREDTPDTFDYVDPPYYHPTRASTKEYGKWEMDEAQHIALLKVLREVQGMVMVSGYPNQLYDDLLHDWKRYTLEIPNQASGAREKRVMVEKIWLNYVQDPDNRAIRIGR
jgi:DNA adenine methylase